MYYSLTGWQRHQQHLFVVHCTGGVQHLVVMWHREAVAPVHRLSPLQGQRAGQGSGHRQHWAVGPSVPHPWKSSPPVNTCLVSVLGAFGLCLFFCFPFQGSDVVLAPVVTCFITSSFNNVSTDLSWRFGEHTLPSNSTSCAVSLLQH